MEATVWFAGIFCIFIGWIVAHLEYRRGLRNLQNIHQNELIDARFDGYDEGAAAALADRNAVADAAAKHRVHFPILFKD